MQKSECPLSNLRFLFKWHEILNPVLPTGFVVNVFLNKINNWMLGFFFMIFEQSFSI